MIAALSLLVFLGLFTLAPLLWAQVGLPWATLVVTFVVIPLLDAAIGPPRRNVFAATSPRLARWVPRAQLPLQALLVGGAVLLAPKMDAAALAALALAVGTVSGGIGITVAHELGHRPGRLDRAIAVVLLAGVFYAHFQVEHIRGHHVRVATPQEPATAPRGMNVYRFIARSIVLGFLHACRLEAIRLAAQGRSPWSPGNVVLAGTFASLLLAVLAYVAGGMPGLALFVGQAIWAVALLEIINYVEHYGLRRARVGARYEPVSVVHSGNADFAISNWLLLNLQLHSDHHAHMNRAYEQLRCMPQAPQLPAGYPTMVLAALLPPLWFRLMDRRLPAAATAA